MKPIIRKKQGQMNNTEFRYAGQLELMKIADEILGYKYEQLKFRLAKATFYTPDFFVVYPTHFEIHEIKGGFVRDDAIVKFKVAAEMYPFFKWKMIQYKKKEWKILKES